MLDVAGWMLEAADWRLKARGKLKAVS